MSSDLIDRLEARAASHKRLHGNYGLYTEHDAALDREAASALRNAGADALREAAEVARETLQEINDGKHPTWNDPMDDGRGGVCPPNDDIVLVRTKTIVPEAILALIGKPAARPPAATGDG